VTTFAPRLRSLRLEGGRFSQAGIAALSASRRDPLTRIWISGLGIPADAEHLLARPDRNLRIARRYGYEQEA
jgi:hypothetical protein